MMEVGLNALWLVAAFAGAVAWNTQRGAFTRVTCARGNLALVALSSALVLLFPVISVTDDLRDDQPVIEDTSTTVKKLKSTVDGNGSDHHMMVAALTAAVAHFPGDVEARMTVLAFMPAQSCTRARSNGRAPPASLL